MINRLTLVLWGSLLLAGCNSPADLTEHDVIGVIAEIPEDRETIVLSHEAIPGYMEAMVMRFSVSTPDLLDGIVTGNEVSFRLLTDGEAAVIKGIDKISEHIQVFPEFELETLEGDPIGSESFSGKVTLINFWASWCGPCKIEIPWFVEMKEQYGEDFEIIGIAQDPSNREAISDLMAELGINYTVLMSDGGVEARVGGVHAVPTTFVLDRDARVVGRHVGLVQKAVLEEELAELF
jgi:thiol-disulfide isomerase/thioredoxin